MNILLESYLSHLQEWEETKMIDYCRSLDCPKKKVICLKLARMLVSPNLDAQHKIDREIDEVITSFPEVREQEQLDYDADAPGDTGMVSKTPPYDTQEVEIPDEDADKQQKEKLLWSDGKKDSVLNNPSKMNIEFLQFLEEAGFKHYPKGWSKKSVSKYSHTLVKGGAKPKGFFDKCVEKLRGKVKNPEGLCASQKDIAFGSTGWRGKGKTSSEVKKSIQKKQFKLKK